MAANSRAISTNDTTTLSTRRTTSACGSSALTHPLNIVSAALATSETISNSPRISTRARLMRRARTNAHTAPARGFAFQITLRAACISPNTPLAAISSVTMPTTVAIQLEPRCAAPFSMLWIASALCAPIRAVTCVTTAPRASSEPKISPATAIMMRSTGASAKTV